MTEQETDQILDKLVKNVVAAMDDIASGAPSSTTPGETTVSHAPAAGVGGAKTTMQQVTPVPPTRTARRKVEVMAAAQLAAGGGAKATVAVAPHAHLLVLVRGGATATALS